MKARVDKLQERVLRLMVAREIDRALGMIQPRVSPETFAHVLAAARTFAAERSLRLRTPGAALAPEAGNVPHVVLEPDGRGGGRA